MDDAERAERDWRTRGREIVEIYRNEGRRRQPASGAGPVTFNILFANTEDVAGPSTKPPQPVVRSRFVKTQEPMPPPVPGMGPPGPDASRARRSPRCAIASGACRRPMLPWRPEPPACRLCTSTPLLGAPPAAYAAQPACGTSSRPDGSIPSAAKRECRRWVRQPPGTMAGPVAAPPGLRAARAATGPLGLPGAATPMPACRSRRPARRRRRSRPPRRSWRRRSTSSWTTSSHEAIKWR